MLLLSASGFSQKQTLDKLPSLFIGKGENLIFRSPEPVQFVDISTDKLIGDMPAENIIILYFDDFFWTKWLYIMLACVGISTLIYIISTVFTCRFESCTGAKKYKISKK